MLFDTGEMDSDKTRQLAEQDPGTGTDEESSETPECVTDRKYEEAKEMDQPDSEASKAHLTEPKLKNQFDFYEMDTQTLDIQYSKMCQTEPVLYTDFSANCDELEIYNAYTEELKKKMQSEKQKVTQDKKDDDKINDKTVMAETQLQTADLIKGAKTDEILKRIMNENLQYTVFEDFKWIDDPADEYRGQGATLLTLGKFHYNKAKELPVTALCWNSNYKNRFVVGMGSNDFGRQVKGMLLFYSLKDSSCPDRIYPTTSAVQCLDIHPQLTHLVAVGFYDGSVAVYNLKNGKEPVYQSTANIGRHTDPVWQVRWQKNHVDGKHNFCSVSSDSRVVFWTVVQSELIFTDIIKLPVNGPERGRYSSIGGRSLDFHKQIDDLFLVGTGEGKILKCSKTNSNIFLETYNAHTMAVDAVKWNHFHPNVFISCSFDGTIKIWDHNFSTPMLDIDLKTPVVDVAWDPYSSTVFAAVTTDGKVHIFDLIINKAICQEQVVSKGTKLTHIEFNPIDPIIIVGDDQGQVTSLVLSLNLRKKLVTNKRQEVAKMEKLLGLLREVNLN